MHSEALPPVFLAVMILGIHAVLQPYKSWKHNVIDGLIFLDIAIINSITYMIKTSLMTENSSDVDIFALQLVQLAFIYMPIISVLTIITLKIGKWLHCLWKQKFSIRCANEDIGSTTSITAARDLNIDMAVSLVELKITPIEQGSPKYF